MFAGLAWGAGYLDSIPNFEFLTVLLFVGGFVLGPAWGALAAALGEFLYSAMNPYGSGLAVPLVLAAQVAGMALAGVAGGWLGRAALRPPILRAALVIAAGVAVTVVFDLLTNLASAVMFGPIVPTLVAALPFAAIHVATNAALFAAIGVPLVAALERTRRSLDPPALAAALAVVGILLAGPSAAQSVAPLDSTAAVATATTIAAADSSDLVHGRRAAPPAWGDGPAALERRGDHALATWLTREGGMTERFADDRGSAEPLSRFGLPGSRLEIDWLGLPLAGIGAVGGGVTRAPWNAVGSVDAPRLPVSAREAYRGEVGQATIHPWAPLAGHPRVTAWASFGAPEHTGSGFLATATAGRTSGAILVEADGLGTLEPLGPEGNHSIALQGRHETGGLAIDGAYRSTREAAEDLAGRSESRSGEAGRLGARLRAGGTTVALALERTDERLVGGDRIFLADDLSQAAKSFRARLEAARDLGGGDAWLAFTYGDESLESSGEVAFARRGSTLLWGATGYARDLDARTRLDLALGAGTAAGGALDVAPSALLERRVDPGTRIWLGAARGLGARLDPRGVDALGRPIEGDPPLLRTSTWLAGLGVESRSAREQDGGTVRGAWPRGERRVRAALYAGRSEPGFDVAREPLAIDGAAALEDLIDADATRFAALTMSGAIAPWTGLRVEVGGHALARRVADVLQPSDPEWRVHAELESRRAFLRGDLDLRVGVRGELIGARVGTPVGDLPTASRLGLFAAWTLDEFEVRGEIRDLAGANRVLPVPDADGFPVLAETSRWIVEARWTLWD